ncbi:hypothetical protein GDO81_018774, partial [Engystomops pustulosus]
ISVDYVTLIISCVLDIFIIVVNVQDFCVNRRLPLSDQLLLSLSVFGLLHELNEGYLLYINLLLGPYNVYSVQTLHFFTYVNSCTLWLSALLSLHFCLKIVNITQRFYIDLQRRFPMFFPWIIIAFPLGYFFMCLYSSLEINPKCLLNATQQEGISFYMFPRCFWPLLIFMIICVLCAFISLVSTLTIAVSLLGHVRRIQANTEGSRSPNIDAHIQAVKTVTGLLIANILRVTFVSTLALSELKLQWEFILGILIFFSHILSSYFFIKGTKKLHNALTEFLSC